MEHTPASAADTDHIYKAPPCSHRWKPQLIQGDYVLCTCDNCNAFEWLPTPLHPEQEPVCTLQSSHVHGRGPTDVPALHPLQEPSPLCYAWRDDGRIHRVRGED